MSLPADHFDVVVSQEVIAHVPDQIANFDLAPDMLEPGGHLIITTPNKFVMDRADFFPPQPPEHLETWLTIRQLKRLLRPRFGLVRSTSILPMGQGGVLRLVNSSKINAMLASFISRRHIETLKERLNFGYTLILLAQQRA